MFRFLLVHYLLIFFFILLTGVMPEAVSAMYGGNPPPHIAKILDAHTEVFKDTISGIVAPLDSLGRHLAKLK